MRVFTTLLIGLFFFCYSYAQDTVITITDILKIALKNSAIKEQNDKIKYLQQSIANTPYIDDVSLRIRNNAYDLKRQRYSLRIEPRGFGETKASKKYYEVNLDYHKQVKKVLENRLLKNRYFLILEYLQLEKTLELYNQLTILYEDKIKVLRKSTGKLSFNLLDLIEVENEYTKLRFKNIERERKLKNYIRKISKIIKVDSFHVLDTSTLISIEEIKAYIDSTDILPGTENVYIKRGKLRLKRAQRRYQLENAENRQYINFLEFSYDHGRMREELDTKNENETLPPYLQEDYNLNRAYSIEIAFRLPFFNVDRRDINRRKLSYLEEKEAYRELKSDFDKRIEKDSIDIAILLGQYSFLKARKSDVDAESSLKKYLEMEGVDPLKLLDIRESIIKNDIALAQIKNDIMRNYIRIIDANGRLYARPLKNYLAASMEVVEE